MRYAGVVPLCGSGVGEEEGEGFVRRAGERWGEVLVLVLRRFEWFYGDGVRFE